MYVIDLTEDLGPKNHTLLNQEFAKQLRTKYDLDVLDNANEPVHVFFPHYVREITMSFFDAMFGLSMFHLKGPKKFREHFVFEFEDKNLLGELPEQYWTLIHPPKQVYVGDEVNSKI